MLKIVKLIINYHRLIAFIYSDPIVFISFDWCRIRLMLPRAANGAAFGGSPSLLIKQVFDADFSLTCKRVIVVDSQHDLCSNWTLGHALLQTGYGGVEEQTVRITLIKAITRSISSSTCGLA